MCVCVCVCVCVLHVPVSVQECVCMWLVCMHACIRVTVHSIVKFTCRGCVSIMYSVVDYEVLSS